MEMIIVQILLSIFGLMQVNCGQIHFSEESTKEVCNREDLDIRCSYKETILITKASYGHLHQGRCIPRETGLFGCQADVLVYLDEKCSGKRACNVLDESISTLVPDCGLGLLLFLEANYTCVQGQPISDFCRVIPVEQTPSYFSILTASRSDCILREQSAYVSLSASEGQTIEVTITDFGGNDTVLEGSFLVEENGQRQSVVFEKTDIGSMEAHYISSTNKITLVTADISHNALISYKATGCADVKNPVGTWIQRDRDVATVGCYNTDRTWTLRCIGTKWVGAVGNCTIDTSMIPVSIPMREPAVEVSDKKEVIMHVGEDETGLSKEVWVAIISAATLFACGIVILVGFICIKIAQKQYQCDKPYEMVPLDTRTMRPPDVKDENIRLWQQSLSNNRGAPQNNQLIVMDRDLITINGV